MQLRNTRLAARRTGARRTKVLTAAAVVLGIGAGMMGGAHASSTYSGTQYTVPQTIQVAYNAGFHTENQLVAVVSIGIAESSLYTHARLWHPEYGLRPAGSVIDVPGPASAWNKAHTQQVNSDRGLFQISSHFWGKYTDPQVDNPASAASIMWVISRAGTNFNLWDTYASGYAQHYFNHSYNGWPAVRPLVRSFLKAHGH